MTHTMLQVSAMILVAPLALGLAGGVSAQPKSDPKAPPPQLPKITLETPIALPALEAGNLSLEGSMPVGTIKLDCPDYCGWRVWVGEYVRPEGKRRLAVESLLYVNRTSEAIEVTDADIDAIEAALHYIEDIKPEALILRDTTWASWRYKDFRLTREIGAPEVSLQIGPTAVKMPPAKVREWISLLREGATLVAKANAMMAAE